MNLFSPKIGPVCLMLSFALLKTVAYAGSAVSVNRVSFDKVGRDEWLRTRIQITASANPSENAKNLRYLDSVKVKVYLSFGDPRKGFSFYSSEVQIVTLEQGERYLLDFFLPGQIVKRDKLNTTPFAYLLELFVGEFQLPFESSCGSSNMSNEAARRAFIDNVSGSKQETDGILLPSYHAPVYLILEEEDQYPAFRRALPAF